MKYLAFEVLNGENLQNERLLDTYLQSVWNTTCDSFRLLNYFHADARVQQGRHYVADKGAAAVGDGACDGGAELAVHVKRRARCGRACLRQTLLL